LSLVESLIASVVLAIATIGIASSLSGAAKQTGDLSTIATMNTIGRALMEEVSALPFTGPALGDQGGWSKGNTNRATYDSLDDFNGYTDQSPFTMLDGTTVPLDDGQKYQREVEVQFRATPSGEAQTSGDFAMIRIRVSSGAVGTVVIEKLLTNFTQKR
jgi:type II secretory pathway pseudopilin PulG